MLIYCVKCRTKREATDLTDTVFKNGKKAKRGTCTVCGKGLVQIVAG